MASTTGFRSLLRQTQPNFATFSRTVLLPTTNRLNSPIRSQIISRHASSAGQSGDQISRATHFHVPRWIVYVFAPSALAMLGFLQITNPDQATNSVENFKQGLQVGNKASGCAEVHASDLDDWIKTHPDEIDDAHAVGWHKMYNAFTEHALKQGEPARIEAENARQLAEYARKQDSISRSTKEAGKMATLSANKNIGDLATVVEGSQSGFVERMSENVAARIGRAQKMFTRATKGRAFGDV